ncbi:MAG TPA: hypothetical protein VKP66_07265, partial [Steroidobacteraceae bacterium]|nr:hypothetical protein [Steroidobacteraceae bacterium]
MKFSLIAIAASCALTASAFAMNTPESTSASTGHAPRLSLTDITPVSAPRLTDITPVSAPR